jgi:histidine ammonia-lyase
MAPHGARRLGPMAENLARIIGIEALMAAQGVEMRLPLTTSPRLQAALAVIRAVAAPLEQDRVVSGDMEAAAALVRAGALAQAQQDILAHLFEA